MRPASLPESRLARPAGSAALTLSRSQLSQRVYDALSPGSPIDRDISRICRLVKRTHRITDTVPARSDTSRHPPLKCRVFVAGQCDAGEPTLDLPIERAFVIIAR
jgi:hypothetical protein